MKPTRQLNRPRPSQYSPANDINGLFKKINQLCHSKVSNVSGALDLLSNSLNKQDISSSKIIYLAAKLAAYDPDLSQTWVDGVIKHFIAISENAADWFAKPQSSFFLFAFNISVGSHRESQLRIIADFALSKFIPTNKFQLIDHLKIVSVLVQQHKAQNTIYPTGPVFLIQLILSGNFHFAISKSITEATVKMYEALTTNGPVSLISPELSQRFVESTSSSLPSASLSVSMKKLRENAAVVANRRIEDFKSQRVFPPMIQQVLPLLEHKAITDEKKLKMTLKKEKQKTKRDIRQANLAIKKDRLERKRQHKEEQDKSQRKVLAMLESENTYDLNMAAAPAHEEEEEKDDELEAMNKKIDEGLIDPYGDVEIDESDSEEEDDSDDDDDDDDEK